MTLKIKKSVLAQIKQTNWFTLGTWQFLLQSASECIAQSLEKPEHLLIRERIELKMARFPAEYPELGNNNYCKRGLTIICVYRKLLLSLFDSIRVNSTVVTESVKT